ncbi:hypothetical protein FHW84_003328 [Dyella sp. SG562]|nr:hypothetical protein [Dyella sp. SG562]
MEARSGHVGCRVMMEAGGIIPGRARRCTETKRHRVSCNSSPRRGARGESTWMRSALRSEEDAGRQMRGGCSRYSFYEAKKSFWAFSTLHSPLRPPPHPNPLPGGERGM